MTVPVIANWDVVWLHLEDKVTTYPMTTEERRDDRGTEGLVFEVKGSPETVDLRETAESFRDSRGVRGAQTEGTDSTVLR